MSVADGSDAPAPPLPPRELAAYVVGDVTGEDWAAQFDAIGRHVVDALRDAVPESLAPGTRLLDFGCGSGRVLRHLAARTTAIELHGCDIDGPSVAWVQQHLCPPCRVTVAPTRPPLPYADGFFDAVWAVSVLSQIADGWAGWLLELRRVLRPGGLLVATVIGPQAAPAATGRTVADGDVGMSVHGAGRPWVAGGPMVVHGHWWLRALRPGVRGARAGERGGRPARTC